MNNIGRFASLAALFSVASVACAKDEPAPNTANNVAQTQQPGAQQGTYPQQQGTYPQQQGTYPQQQGTYPQQQGTYPQQPATTQPTPYPQQPATTQPTQPGTTQPAWPTIPGFPPAGGTAPAAAPQAGQSGTAQAIDPNLAAAAAAPMATLAASEAPGAVKEGAMPAANFQQGQTIEESFTMQPGKCYTIIASSVGIQQLDITVVATTPIPGMSPQFGTAQGKAGMAGSQAVLGSKTNCLKLAFSPIAIQAKYIVTATKGAGLAAAQLYSK